MNPLDLNLDNLAGVWENLKYQILATDVKFSPALAGEIAACRIALALASAADTYRKDMDRKARNGDDITDDEDALYASLPFTQGAISRRLEHLSGIRAWGHVAEHPLATGPI